MRQLSIPWWMRIKERVLIFGIAMSILPLLFLGMASFYAVRLHLEGSIQKQNFERASVLAEQIGEYVRNAADSLTNITSTSPSVLVGKDQTAREVILGTILREEPYLEAVAVADQNFSILSQLERRDVILPSQVPSKLANLEFTDNPPFSISSVFFSADGRPEFYLTVGIRDPQTRKNIGYLQAKTDLKGLVTKFTNLRIGRDGYVYITDEKGVLIGHADFSYVLRQENMRQNPMVASFLAGNQPEQGSEYKNPDGVKVMGLFARVGTPNWAVFIEQPVREAYEPIYKFALKLLWIVLITMVIVTLVSIIFGLRLTRPIENLEGEVRRIILTGNLHKSIPQETRDEIGCLVQSFNQLMYMLNEKNEKLKTEKELFRTVVDGIGAGMVLLDTDKRIIWWNSIFAKWFETANLQQNLPCREIFQSEGIDCLTAENGKVISLEVDGNHRYIRQMFYRLTPGSQENAAYLLLLEDVTHQVVMEARVIETDKMAAVGLLASGVAHEINNPLAIVSAHSEDLLDRLREESPGPASEEIIGVLKIVSDQIVRCKQITERLLHFARRGRQGRDLVDTGIATAQTVMLLRHQAKQKGVNLQTRLEEGLFVLGNENEWQQVVLNVLTNALDASSKGGEIEVRAWRENAKIHVEVKDEGQGIPAGNLKKVLDPFFTTKPVGQGTGLGLFVSYGIVQKMQGYLMIDSVEGKGTTVRITLPAHEAGDKK